MSKPATSLGDREAFLRQMIAVPLDQTTRLVFADWLQEHGEDDRAALLREPGGVRIFAAKLARGYFGYPTEPRRRYVVWLTDRPGGLFH